jgi:amidase
MPGVEDLYLAEDGVGLAASLRAGRCSARELLQCALDRAEMVNAQLGAMCQIDGTGALAELSRLDPGAPFAGVPFLMKDLGAPIRGFATVAGARYFMRNPANSGTDSDLVRRLRRAGVVIFGKTTVPELGLNLASEPLIGPVARNPWNLHYGAGGSSGGSAGAVAAGIVPIAYATDAGGSIRVPAAICGVVGLKPSRGLIPQGPDFGNLLLGVASEFVVSRTARDSAAMLDVCAGAPHGPYGAPSLQPHGPAADMVNHPLSTLRIGLVLAGPDWAPIGDQQSAAIRAGARLLEAQGHVLEPLPDNTLEPKLLVATRFFEDVICASLAALADELDPAPVDDDFEPMTWAAIERGHRITAARLTIGARETARVAHFLATQFDRYDAILTPMLSGPPPLVGALPTDNNDISRHFSRMAALAPYATIVNATGLPAISIPHACDRAGLPLAIQIIGPTGSDILLLQLARFFEAAAPWSFPFSTSGGNV